MQKNYSWDPNTCICENDKYLKIIGDDSNIVCDEIIYVMDIVSAKMTNTIATNVTSITSINFHSKKIRCKIDCYTLHTVLLVITLLLMIPINCYHCANHRSKLKSILLC